MNPSNLVNVLLRLAMYISQVFNEKKVVLSNNLTKIYEAANDRNIEKKKLAINGIAGTNVRVLKFCELNHAQHKNQINFVLKLNREMSK